MSQHAQTYLKNQVATASPEQLRLLLYDGALKFCRQARHTLVRKDFEGMYHALLRAQKIVLELINSLNHQVAPDLCDRMTGLYSFIYRRLVDASLERDVEAVDECVNLIEYERQTWIMLMDRLKKQRSGEGSGDDPDRWDRSSDSTNAPPLASIGPDGPEPPGDDPPTRLSVEG
ncbi:MAG: flagellar export chaperone FliS [Phycisphaeraceae bacterium]|nr:flagellar export chaperone FliS [Phycisphaeraceae bacterium]